MSNSKHKWSPIPLPEWFKCNKYKMNSVSILVNFVLYIHNFVEMNPTTVLDEMNNIHYIKPKAGKPYSSETLRFSLGVLRVTNLNGLPHSLLSYGHLIPGERACTGRTCLIKKFFQGPSKGRYIPWAVPEDSGYWLNGVLIGWSANG